jgi:precorrin-6B methylase 2
MTNMNVGRIVNNVKEIVLTSLWSRKSLLYLITKDALKILSFFDRRLIRKYKYFLEKYFQEDKKVIKRKRFDKFIFWLRKSDLLLLKEVFLDKDYDLLEDFLPNSNNIVFDLGAGIGDYALLSSIRVDKRGKVISVEADTQAFELLKKNVKENNLKNVVPLNLFVSSEREHSIDFIVEKLRLKRVDLIKMDIEGEEYNALKGAIKTIRKFKPKIIIEIHSKNLREKILEFLKNYGYDLVFEKEKKDHGFYLSYFKCN